jgi:hypothetical protein
VYGVVGRMDRWMPFLLLQPERRYSVRDEAFEIRTVVESRRFGGRVDWVCYVIVKRYEVFRIGELCITSLKACCA